MRGCIPILGKRSKKLFLYLMLTPTALFAAEYLDSEITPPKTAIETEIAIAAEFEEEETEQKRFLLLTKYSQRMLFRY